MIFWPLLSYSNSGKISFAHLFFLAALVCKISPVQLLSQKQLVGDTFRPACPLLLWLGGSPFAFSQHTGSVTKCKHRIIVHVGSKCTPCFRKKHPFMLLAIR